MSTGTRERILREAVRLFASQGFKTTTVAQIEGASGLKPGSGALFAHFPTKEAVLDAAIADLADLNRGGQSSFDVARIGDLRSELIVFARAALLTLDMQRDIVRLWLKEAENFPGLQAVMERQVNQPAARWMADWLQAKVKARLLEDHDCEAVGTIALGSITAWWLWKQTAGEEGPAVDEDRFVYGWADLLLRLAPPAAPKRARSR